MQVTLYIIESFGTPLCSLSVEQGRLTINNRYTHHEFKLKFSALLEDYDLNMLKTGKNNLLKHHCV